MTLRVPKAPKAKTMEEWLVWRDAMRSKHRVMTLGEYIAWGHGGDAISSPTSSNSFPGGLTVLFTAPIIGKVED